MLFISALRWFSLHHAYCPSIVFTVCYQLLKAPPARFCLPQTTFLHPLCGSFWWSGINDKAGKCTTFKCYTYSNRALPVLRTPETPLAVFFGAFLLSAKRSPVVDFPLHLRASTCSSCPTTARRASCATSCAMLSAWTLALSSPNVCQDDGHRRVVFRCLHQSQGSADPDWSLLKRHL